MYRTLALVALLVLSASSAPAQSPGTIGRPPGPGNPGFRPTVSPFLNLSRGGNPAINYYGIVRPQVEETRTLQSFGKQLNTVESPMSTTGTVNPLQGLPGTTAAPTVTTPETVVQAAGFMTHLRNFQTTSPNRGQSQGNGGITGGISLPTSRR